MSEHDIEDLVHASILILDRIRHPRLRDWCTTLYAFQRTHDCSHTMGRVEDILLRCGHTYRFPLDGFPEYAHLTDEFTELGEYDEEDPDEGVQDGYVRPPWLYCEAGTRMWRRMVDEGRLRGADAQPPRPAGLIDVVATVAEAAERDGDVELIAMWWGLGHQTLVGGTPFGPEDLEEIPAVRRLREVVERCGAYAFALPDGFRPTQAELETLDDELETWWYRIPA
ncbi:hypothetical protein ACQP2P_29085 [Dactylosporangium sp. CA-139114]|uniref:hypothetical protein n=1 Tax=Dactylosporangium sp. CA-139114 TaxID=3239931 RepID=UPI003D99C236